MFSELGESIARRSSKRKRWALAASATVQIGCLSMLILAPLIYTQALPKAIVNTIVVGFPGLASRPAPETRSPRSGPHSVRLLNRNILTAPTHIPQHARVFEEPPLTPELPGGESPIDGNSQLNLLAMAPPADEKVSRAPAPEAEPRRLVVTSTIEGAKLISRMEPIYPALAIQARIQGNVVLHAVISKEGSVSEAQVLSGHPLLVNAALQAVREWRYSPTLLNGQAVEVETTITVSFVLGE